MSDLELHLPGSITVNSNNTFGLPINMINDFALVFDSNIWPKSAQISVSLHAPLPKTIILIFQSFIKITICKISKVSKTVLYARTI